MADVSEHLSRIIIWKYLTHPLFFVQSFTSLNSKFMVFVVLNFYFILLSCIFIFMIASTSVSSTFSIKRTAMTFPNLMSCIILMFLFVDRRRPEEETYVP